MTSKSDSHRLIRGKKDKVSVMEDGVGWFPKDVVQLRVSVRERRVVEGSDCPRKDSETEQDPRREHGKSE